MSPNDDDDGDSVGFNEAESEDDDDGKVSGEECEPTSNADLLRMKTVRDARMRMLNKKLRASLDKLKSNNKDESEEYDANNLKEGEILVQGCGVAEANGIYKKSVRYYYSPS